MIFPLEGYEVLTVERAKGLSWRDEVFYFSPERWSPGGKYTCSPRRFRVNGEPKTWKRSPDRVKVPIINGLYVYGHITEDNVSYFYVEVA
jgi:hypothetical protein